MLIIKTSIQGNINSMELNITEEQLTRWQNGELIQDVMPHLTPEQREFLITGMSIEEQNNFFKEENP